MKTIKSISIGMIAVLALALTASAAPGDGPRQAFGGPGPWFGGPGQSIERMAEHLGLDDVQKQTIQNILEAAKPELDALREAQRTNHEALVALDPADPNYSTAINDIAAEKGRLVTEGTLLRSRVRNEINAVLTDEQREQLGQGRQRMRGAIGERRPRRL